MKLNRSVVTHEIGGTQILVSADSSVFSGMVRSNKTAAFIVDCLKEETTKESIMDAMLEKFDAPRDMIEQDVDKVLAKLRSIGLLDE